MTAFGRFDEMPPDYGWQQLPQQQNLRGGGAEGTGDPGPGGGGDGSREAAIGRGGRSRSRSSPGPASRSRSPSRSRGGGRSAAIGPMSDAAISGDPSGLGHPSAISASDRGGGFVGALNTKLQDFMTPDLTDPKNPKMGALSLLPGMGFAVGLGAMFQDIGERFGIEMGPAPDVAESGSQGAPGDMYREPPGQMLAKTDQPGQDAAADGMTPEERERQKNIRRGLGWYTALMGGASSWAPGSTRL